MKCTEKDRAGAGREASGAQRGPRAGAAGVGDAAEGVEMLQTI